MPILGHSQVSLTLGTYSHVVTELAEDAAVRVGNALWGQVAHHGGTTDDAGRLLR